MFNVMWKWKWVGKSRIIMRSGGRLSSVGPDRRETGAALCWCSQLLLGTPSWLSHRDCKQRGCWHQSSDTSPRIVQCSSSYHPAEGPCPVCSKQASFVAILAVCSCSCSHQGWARVELRSRATQQLQHNTGSSTDVWLLEGRYSLWIVLQTIHRQNCTIRRRPLLGPQYPL